MLGIVQGRLTYAGKKLQAFPKNPFKEFSIASKTGYDFIEFFSERNVNKQNPIWSNKGIKKYIKIAKLNKIKIYSFCDDYVINHSLASLKTKNLVLKTIEKLQRLSIKKYILPLYGKSLINSKNKYKIYEHLSIIAKICKKNKIELLLESNMTPKEFGEVKKNISSKNCFFLFDSGNRVILKRNSILDIQLFGKNIRHIHLKDKNIHKKNVIIGKGMVDFELFFLTLKKIRYKGSFTIESQRGINIEMQAKKNYLFFKNLIKKYKI
jgi:sugar phosphate isomerase/epimerase